MQLGTLAFRGCRLGEWKIRALWAVMIRPRRGSFGDWQADRVGLKQEMYQGAWKGSLLDIFQVQERCRVC